MYRNPKSMSAVRQPLTAAFSDVVPPVGATTMTIVCTQAATLTAGLDSPSATSDGLRIPVNEAVVLPVPIASIPMKVANAANTDGGIFTAMFY